MDNTAGKLGAIPMDALKRAKIEVRENSFFVAEIMKSVLVCVSVCISFHQKCKLSSFKCIKEFLQGFQLQIHFIYKQLTRSLEKTFACREYIMYLVA